MTGSLRPRPEPPKALRDTIARAEARLADLASEHATVAAELRKLRAELAAAETTDTARVLVTAESTPQTPAEKVALFRSLFAGRDDVFAKFWQNPKTGRKGYAPACRNEWVRGVCEKPRVKCGECPDQAFIPVTDEVVTKHLRGRLVMGFTPCSAARRADSWPRTSTAKAGETTWPRSSR